MFKLGQTVITRNAMSVCAEFNIDPIVMLARHSRRDWGDLDKEDKLLNDLALKQGDRLLSKYVYSKQSFYVITEYDRSITTVMMCSDY